MPLTVVAIIHAKPGSEEAVQDTLKDLARASRQDQGCLSYDLKRGTADPTLFLTVEEWESQADLDAHMQAPAVGAAIGAMGDHLAKAPEINVTDPVEA